MKTHKPVVNSNASKKRQRVALRLVPLITGWSFKVMFNILRGSPDGNDAIGADALISPKFGILHGNKPTLYAYEYCNASNDIKILPRRFDQNREEIVEFKKEKGWRNEVLAGIPANWYVYSTALKKAFEIYHDVKELSDERPEDYFELDWTPPLGNDMPLIAECPQELLLNIHIDREKSKKDTKETPEIATESPIPSPKPQNVQGFPTPPGTKWEDITIKFFDGHTVYITAGDKSGQYSYEAMGMNNRKSSKPNKQCELLEKLAENHGEATFKNDSKLKATKKNLTKSLRIFFGLTSDPFEYKKPKYIALFVILPE